MPSVRWQCHSCIAEVTAFVCHFLISNALQHLQLKRRTESERGKKEGSVFLIHRVLSFCGVALPRSAGPPFSQSWTKAKKALSYRLCFQCCSLLAHISCTKMQCRKAQQCLHAVHHCCSSAVQKGFYRSNLTSTEYTGKRNRGRLRRQKDRYER